ncbi:MAG: hypothetical protein L0Y71_11800 [Gemmataceae bacterium]|nr:hypothetical protein [Gemmataceae bacterium]
MRIPHFVWALAVVVALAAAGFLTRASWLPWLTAPSAPQSDDDSAPAPAEPKLLKLSPQARRNLALTSKPYQAQSYWRAIEVPGVIIDRPGQTDRVVVAPAAAVVAAVHAFPGDIVKPGERLFTLRLIGEQVQATQAELLKVAREIEFTQQQRARLEELKKTVSVPEARFIELDIQIKRFTAAGRAYRQELLSRGLTAVQIDGIVAEKFVTQIEVQAPKANGARRAAALNDDEPAAAGLEVEQLKVELGQQVNGGQLLCLLADHRALFIEGHSFQREAPWLARAAEHGWPLGVEFAEDASESWPALSSALTIRHLSNTVDPSTRTLSFYVPLTNQSRIHRRDGRAFAVWRFRPGQRVRLRVPVQEYQDVIVMPAGAVVREGPEAYVFRQNGDLFERRPVHVLHEDRSAVVLANDGSVRPGLDYLAQGAAGSLNRILQAQHAGGGLPPGAHFHADGSLHIPGK